MGNANIPDDWEGEYIDYVVKWPLSQQWEAILRGQLTAPKFEDFWDVNSGDPEPSQDAMDETFDTNLHLQEGALIPAGITTFFAGETIPDGWLEMDGSTISRVTYARLFAAIGTIYGEGDGSTTFEIPDARGRALVCQNELDETFDEIGETMGTQTVTISTNEMPSHTHNQNSHNHTQNSHSHPRNISNAQEYSFANVSGTVGPTGGSLQANLFSDTGNTTATNQATTATNQNTGGGMPHNNIQPSLVLKGLIKV